jgi:hypothetical protein
MSPNVQRMLHEGVGNAVGGFLDKQCPLRLQQLLY